MAASQWPRRVSRRGTVRDDWRGVSILLPAVALETDTEARLSPRTGRGEFAMTAIPPGSFIRSRMGFAKRLSPSRAITAVRFAALDNRG